MFDPKDMTEQYRLSQGGMGFLQYHAAVVWMRTLLKAVGASYEEEGEVGLMDMQPAPRSPRFGGPTGLIRAIRWKVNSRFWISFDVTSYGHLLYSKDGKTWEGMDATYYAPDGKIWGQLLRRVEGSE